MEFCCNRLPGINSQSQLKSICMFSLDFSFNLYFNLFKSISTTWHYCYYITRSLKFCNRVKTRQLTLDTTESTYPILNNNLLTESYETVKLLPTSFLQNSFYCICFFLKAILCSEIRPFKNYTATIISETYLSQFFFFFFYFVYKITIYLNKNIPRINCKNQDWTQCFYFTLLFIISP